MQKINSVPPAEHSFTSVLVTIHTPPKQLYYRGTLPEVRPPCVAIIGTRRPTEYGREVSYRLAHDLAKAGICVISGLALGIDAIAHQAALDAGGTTIAVLAGGLHRTYPASHHQLGEAIIASGGALISESPAGEEARRHSFLARNRLISGLADAVIVTEAAERSGTLSTVGHALDQNKDVFAVPGPITSLLSVGPNRLIQQGAHVLLSAQDVLTLFGLERRIIVPQATTPLEQHILSFLESGIRDGDELLEHANVEAGEFLQTLTMMEIRGVIRPLGNNKWTRV